MNLFGYKNKKEEFLTIELFIKQINSLLSQDKYISKKKYRIHYENTISIYNELSLMEEKGILKIWCKKNSVNYKLLKEYLNNFIIVDSLINNHNDEYINNHLISDKEYLDEILKKDDPNIILDEEQRKVVLSDEDYTLVVAGAGSGKTTTIEAKVKYLVEKMNVSPEKILIVSYTRKATNELKQRFKRLELNVNISTFHSIANTIIKNNEEKRHNIVSNGFMYDIIRKYLIVKLDDEYFIKKILLFFASYLNDNADNIDMNVLHRTLQDSKSTMKSDIQENLDIFHISQTTAKRTINNERVKSIEECKIANFLYINNIDYCYEPVYQYGFKDTIKPYCPDFVIKQGEKEIYLEHFGITEDGKSTRYDEETLKKYINNIKEKIALHKEHGTKLIYTFSKYKDGRDFIEHLRELLIKENIVFDTKSNVEIYRKIAKNLEDKYFNKLILLICNFISKFKINNYPISKFDEWKINAKSERTKLFIDICYQCYLVYANELKSNNSIDFGDMINDAANILDEKIKNHEKLEYEYILVDEYQDISNQRFDLCEKLSKVSDAKIIAVGDDWQSIFKFSGAKIKLFTNFKEKMGYANILKITNTYRNSQELIDIAGKFIMQNEFQFKKALKSNKNINDPIILMTYDDSYKRGIREGVYQNFRKTIEQSLDHIVENNPNSRKILLIGRYGYEGKNLLKDEDFFYFDNNKIRSRKYPKLEIEYMTAHSSKGLGYDEVIIINGKDEIMGFPSKIVDDPVMKLVINDDYEMDYAEERRLFYVALTRTKNRIYLITPQHAPSKFILEIKNDNSQIKFIGNDLNPIEEENRLFKCPICGYPLQKRKSNIKNTSINNTLWICTNEPEICGYITNDLFGGELSISKCPKCEDGFLIIKPIKNNNEIDTNARMLGCTNYKKDGTGCNMYIMPKNYTQDLEKLVTYFLDKDLNLEKMIYMNYPIKEIIFKILKIIDMVEKRYSTFKFNYFSLSDYLFGNKTKAVISFELDKMALFGFLTENKKAKFNLLFNELINNEILVVENNLYKNLTIKNYNPSDELIKKIYFEIIAKQ